MGQPSWLIQVKVWLRRHSQPSPGALGRRQPFQLRRPMMIRRLLIAALLSVPLAACQTAQQPVATADDNNWYVGSIPDQPHNIPLVDRRKMDPKYARQTVEYKGPEKPGSIVVDI